MSRAVALLASVAAAMLLASVVVVAGPVKQAKEVLSTDPGRIAFVSSALFNDPGTGYVHGTISEGRTA